MNVLLIGGSGSLINSLIVKFKKEGHRIFLLTGDRYKKQKYEPVFERYNFAYSSENLQEIMESVRPDITIYTGALIRITAGCPRNGRPYVSHRIL